MKALCVFLLVFVFSSGQVLGQETLHDVLSDESCDLACFMGIQPGITSHAELENILVEANIAYEVSSLGTQEGSYMFSFVPDATPFIVENEQVGVITNQDIVVQVGMILENVTLTDVIEQYGSPARIADTGGLYELVYPSQGLVFSVSNTDYNTVFLVVIRDEPGVTGSFMEDTGSVSALEPCVEPASLCSIQTATPIPVEIPSPPSKTASGVLANQGCIPLPRIR